MIRVLLELWPVLLPLLAYLVWHGRRVAYARKHGAHIPRLWEGPWLWYVLASVCIGTILLFAWGINRPVHMGHYIPPHMENGEIIPGHTEP